MIWTKSKKHHKASSSGKLYAFCCDVCFNALCLQLLQHRCVDVTCCRGHHTLLRQLTLREGRGRGREWEEGGGEEGREGGKGRREGEKERKGESIIHVLV